jgi:hypothetical protein
MGTPLDIAELVLAPYGQCALKGKTLLRVYHGE